MNNQFATQFLLSEVDEYDSLRDMLTQLGAEEDSIELLVKAVKAGALKPSQAVDIIKKVNNKVDETSAVGGGVTGGPAAATFTPGAGEQVAGTKKAFKKKYQEDAPMLAGGKKADISTYTKDGFTKAPSKETAAKQIKGVEVKDLWEEVLEESRAYSQFKKQTSVRSEAEQLHQAAKMIQHKLQEVDKLLEFTSQMRQELSEGEQTVEYKTNTKKMFEKIHSKVVEVYTKVKSLK